MLEDNAIICGKCNKFPLKDVLQMISISAQYDIFSDFVLRELPLAVAIANSQFKIEMINIAAQHFFGLSNEEAASHMCGDVFKCVNASLPGGCGATLHCEKCILRKSIFMAFQGEVVSRLKGKFTVLQDGEIKPLTLLVTAAPKMMQEIWVAIVLIEDVSLITELEGLLPMCCVCHKIQDDNGDWIEVAQYIKKHSEAEFTHDYCPACSKQLLLNTIQNKER
jgi:hypothetical protein